jgi:hypothetical protein
LRLDEWRLRLLANSLAPLTRRSSYQGDKLSRLAPPPESVERHSSCGISRSAVGGTPGAYFDGEIDVHLTFLQRAPGEEENTRRPSGAPIFIPQVNSVADLNDTAKAMSNRPVPPPEGSGRTPSRYTHRHAAAHKSQLEKNRLEKKQLDLREAAPSAAIMAFGA